VALRKQSFDNIEVRQSPIEGLGVFAKRTLRQGERIRRVNIVREVTAEEPLREDAGERAEHCAYPNGKVVLWGYPDRHVNHSCDPNAYELHEGDSVYIVARRNIAPGQEITFDYNINMSGGDTWPCNCGAARCRGESVGDFFHLPQDQQREYRPLLADWFVATHRERIEALDAGT
jgi:hypothetical protein